MGPRLVPTVQRPTPEQVELAGGNLSHQVERRPSMRMTAIAAAAILTGVSLGACGTTDDSGGGGPAPTLDRPTLGHGCTGREGEQAVDQYGGRAIVCTTVVNKRGTGLEVKWAVDEPRMTATNQEVETALADAIASAERLVTGRQGNPNTPALLPACRTLERVARRANDSRRIEVAQFCISEIESISAARPAKTVNPGILARLRQA